MKNKSFLKDLEKKIHKPHHVALFRLKLFGKFEKYTLIGILTTILNFGIFYILVTFLNVFYIFATIGAYFIGASANYTLNRGWNFKDTELGFIHGYERFMSASVFTILLTLGLMWVFVSKLSYPNLISRGLVGMGVGIISFTIDCKFIFKKIKRKLN